MESCVTVVQQCAEADFSPDLAKFSSYQQEDPEMASMFAYLVNDILPEDDKVSRRLVLESKQFEVTDGVLYHENCCTCTWSMVSSGAKGDTYPTAY